MANRVLPQHREIVRRFCAHMAEVARKATRRMWGGTEAYYSVPVYRVKRDIVAISPTKRGVTFSFTYGAAFDDPRGKLTGQGKRSRTVQVTKVDAYPEAAMADYIRQAVAQDLA